MTLPIPCAGLSQSWLPSPIAMGEGLGVRADAGDYDAPKPLIPPPPRSPLKKCRLEGNLSHRSHQRSLSGLRLFSVIQMQ